MLTPQRQVFGALLVAVSLLPCCAPRESTKIHFHAEDLKLDSSGTKSDGDAICEGRTLSTSAIAFLSALEADRISDAAKFYEHSDSDLAAYAFGTDDDAVGLMRVSKSERWEVRYLRKFRDGPLVAFYDASKRSSLSDSNWWEERKFEDYFVCEFKCTKGGWVISSQGSCFEETGDPFGD